MGKKSKKKQNGAAKAKGGAASSATAVDVAQRSVYGVGIVTGKKQKCVQCFCNIKPDKIFLCPGCSAIFCWRCEKKKWVECVNHTNCLRPARKCVRCISGVTIGVGLLDANMLPNGSENRIVEVNDAVAAGSASFADVSRMVVSIGGVRNMFQLIAEENKLNDASLPFVFCESCDVDECMSCAYSTEGGPGVLFSCSVCLKTKCKSCSIVPFKSSDFVERYGELLRQIPDGKVGYQELIGCVLGHPTADAILSCTTCSASFCFRCMEERSLRSLIFKSILAMIDRSKVQGEFHCSHCYWASKPCTNPSCPNEAGVPTKRCGGCHLDRYCSVECQAAAYPGHMARCQKITAKRAEAGKSERE